MPVLTVKCRLTSASPEEPEGMVATEALLFGTEDELTGREL